MIVTSLFNSNPLTFNNIDVPDTSTCIISQEDFAEYDRELMDANRHAALEKYYDAKMAELQLIREEAEAQRLAEEEAQRQAEAEALAQSYANYAYDSSAYSMSEYEAKEWIAMKESSGRYDVYSPCGRWYGRYQMALAYFDGRYGGDGSYSPENQEIVADAYVAERYGSWAAAQQFWMANGWY